MADDLASAISTQHARARWTTYLLWLCLALDLIAVGSGFMQRGLLSRIAAGEQLGPDVADANDAREHLIGVVQVCAFIVTGIVWLIWLHRAYKNLQLVGSKKSQFTPGWAVGYWFVPLFNLVRAYQIVVDLWIRSDTGNAADNVASLPRPQLVAAWWAVYLFSGFAGRYAASIATESHTAAELLTVTNVDMLADALSIAAALLAIAVVRGIDQRQQRFAISTSRPS
jgi:hypothetical protein